ncbi:pyroglutamyl-peptidase I [Bacillus chungangensis]|uniref:Pyroglutamyl-peptidase I n=1 Tax=Bacillus chungangensis TaxID=587633 RepID=A0ABT9WZX3_9BACI|nr:pyroglutamyl-peptidase I [Bacillus chungangensis]MDQ0178412.1 pyroglutamyl-peptidase [Bacillus chungangensis]
MKKLLLTGFEPFLDYPVNPTEKIVQALDGTKRNHINIVGKILTVDFQQSGRQLLKYFREEKPDAVISLGLAGGRYKITPERIAINCNDGAGDNRGNKPQGEKIDENGPDGLFSTLPIREITAKLQEAGYPAEISNTAGTYLCNNIMYQMLNEIRKSSKQIPSGFIHIPASHELALRHGKIPSWSHRDLVESILICIDCLAEM